MIIKTKKGWEVVSLRSHRSFGVYPSKTKAIQRLTQIEYFGRKKKWKK